MTDVPRYITQVRDGILGNLTIADSLRDVLAAIEVAVPYAHEMSVLVFDDWTKLPAAPEPWDSGPDALGWRTYRHQTSGSIVHMAVTRNLDPARHPYAITGCTSTSAPLRWWLETQGTLWHGTPGIAGVDALRHALRARIARGDVIVRPDLRRGTPSGMDRIHAAALERDITLTDWLSPAADPTGPTVTVDANMAYLAAAAAAVLPGPALTHYRGADYGQDAGNVGYHLIDLSPWWSKDIPDPAGYLPGNRRRTDTGARWVTTPTLALLHELSILGAHGGYTVLESWVARGARLTRGWAEQIRDMIAGAPARLTGQDLAAATAMGKAAYRETIGLLGRPGGRIYRPDWQSIIIATSRANLWRKVHTAWENGAVPLAFNVDAVTFAGTTPPPNLTIAPGRLGAFKIKETTP